QPTLQVQGAEGCPALDGQPRVSRLRQPGGHGSLEWPRRAEDVPERGQGRAAPRRGREGSRGRGEAPRGEMAAGLTAAGRWSTMMTTMRTRRSFSLAGLLFAAWLLAAAAPVPRPAPAFTFAEPAGKQTPLASLQGKVVVIEFLLTRCPHCWRVAQ